MKVNFQALGCRLNEAELEQWSNDFARCGHQLTLDTQDADLIVFNTCSVTAEADRKSRQQINRIHKSNPNGKLVVTGCYATLQEDQVRQHLGVDLVLGNDRKNDLVNLVHDEFKLPKISIDEIETSSIFSRGRHRAFIKVQDGCRYRCTYCIVTLARGEEKSRSEQEIIAEIQRHHQAGVQEVVLTGVHVGGYGSDTGSDLYRLIATILEHTDIPRLRLASVEPWDLPEHFFDLFSDSRLMPHMHLPIQSGSDSVLRRMSRRCKTGEFLKIVDKAYSAVSEFNITTDLIVGFPGETDTEWQQTMEFMQQIDFGHIHVFSFSPRKGTKAASLPNQIDNAIKKDRHLQMQSLAHSKKITSLHKMQHSTVPVLWERAIDNDQRDWVGYTPNYQKIVASNLSLTGSQIKKVTVQGVDQANGHLTAGSPVVSASFNLAF